MLSTHSDGGALAGQASHGVYLCKKQCLSLMLPFFSLLFCQGGATIWRRDILNRIVCCFISWEASNSTSESELFEPDPSPADVVQAHVEFGKYDRSQCS